MKKSKWLISSLTVLSTLGLTSSITPIAILCSQDDSKETTKVLLKHKTKKQ